MKVIIAGSRNINSYSVIEDAVRESGFSISEVVSGMCRGVDLLGVTYARKHGLPFTKFPAKWDIHGKSAGFIRNVQMAKYADALIAIWDGTSNGTKHMIRYAKKRGLEVFVKGLMKENTSP